MYWFWCQIWPTLGASQVSKSPPTLFKSWCSHLFEDRFFTRLASGTSSSRALWAWSTQVKLLKWKHNTSSTSSGITSFKTSITVLTLILRKILETCDPLHSAIGFWNFAKARQNITTLIKCNVWHLLNSMLDKWLVKHVACQCCFLIDVDFPIAVIRPGALPSHPSEGWQNGPLGKPKAISL